MSSSSSNGLLLLLLLLLLYQTHSSCLLQVLSNITFPNTDAFGGELLSDKLTYHRPLLSQDLDNTFALSFVRTSPSSPGFYLSLVLNFPTKSFIKIVWTANRNHPVKDNATLDFTLNRGFTLRDVDGRLVWSALSDSARGFEMQTLTANLRLIDSRNLTLWQSFDHPTDTILQGQKFAAGLRLVSTISTTDQSDGPYSLVAEPGGLILYASLPDPQPYWTWGYFGLNDTQSVLHTCKNLTYAILPLPYEPFYSSGFLYLSQDSTAAPPSSISPALCGVDNQQQPQVTFLTFNQNLTRYLRLEPNGNLRVYTWNEAWITDFDFLEGDPCLLPNYCGPYGICANGGQCSCPQDNTGLGSNFEMVNRNSPSLGCKPPSNLTCNRDGVGQHMLPLQKGATYFAVRFSSLNATSTIDECKASCLQNCSCQAAFYDNSSSTCFAVPDLKTVRLTSDQNLLAFIKAQTTLISSSRNNKVSVTTAVVASVASVGVVIIFVFSLLVFRKWRSSQAAGEGEEEEDEEALFLETLPGLPPRFSYQELEVATDKFSKKLGKGGFGTVYKGVISVKCENGARNPVEIAVKKLESARQGSKEFRAEVATIGSLNHFNLVRLLGFCAQKSSRLLVYEYMVNGSLDYWLFGRSGQHEDIAILDWDTRFKIAVGTARGIEYLHTQCRELIIHRDIKPHNILLDDHFIPKLSDFGLSKLVDRDQTSVFTAAKGTPAYLAPECQESPSITEKSDVYSYGLVLLEIVGGRRNWDDSFHPSKSYFPAWALKKYLAGEVLELVDERLEGSCNEKQVLRVVGVALLCIQRDAGSRPSMRNVVQMLEGLMDIPPPPPPPSPLVFPFITETFSGISSEVQPSSKPFLLSMELDSSVPGPQLLSCPR